MGLICFNEMKERYKAGEDSLELTVQKWEQILKYSRTSFHLYHFQEILKASVVPIFLCTEYANQCPICPIFSLCSQGRAERWQRLLRVIQAYALAGDVLTRETLSGQIEEFVTALKHCRDEAYQKAN